MNKYLTEKESKVAGLFLEFLLTNEKSHAFKSVVNHFFLEHKIDKARALIICKDLEKKSLVSLILDPKSDLRNLSFDKSRIREFLKNERINKIWITDSKLQNDFKLSHWQLKTYWPLFIFAVFGGLYSGYDFIKNLNKKENAQSKLVTKEEMETELSKLRTLILNKKEDSFPAKSKKAK